MKFATILATVSLCALAASAPLPAESRRGLIPKPMDLVEKMSPNSGIPRLAGKLTKALGVLARLGQSRDEILYHGVPSK
ncbi:hypothetical protein POX_h09458 [Penicillium oxalicum]|uniref:Uncharacterized protein n=1 Tax=Penicillium oxalicum (strain 114-2 / CGMCC 5302) TaxID=933388 RepID=S7ZLF3_PENO1|nr:hypothetical protein POX_h09458 [Penicillium oxalicum]EPS31159.1 hypothetical protein PDE_06114 [Penicillium oxalicum 114-2]KAI2785700.1 hypothetical protein POX_h09458 [Penicillium oxalicum]